MPKKAKFDFRYLWVALWLVFTLALSIWWVIFGIRQLSFLGSVQSESYQEMYRHQQMLIWEGFALVLMLVIGGGALMYMVWREKHRRELIEEFFASFTHELKTSLASLRLQSESLQEDLENRPESSLAARLVGDTVRLEMQLENSLFLSRERGQALLIQKIELDRHINNLKYQWPQLKVNSNLKGWVSADQRALDSIFKNLFQNALVHGQATEVKLWLQKDNHPGKIQIHIEDNGVGFKGDYQYLGQLFHRHGPRSGSGIGLYICKQLVERMGGNWTVLPQSKGFHILIALPGESTGESL